MIFAVHGLMKKNLLYFWHLVSISSSFTKKILNEKACFSIDDLPFIWQVLIEEAKIAAYDHRLLIFQLCRCVHLSLHSLDFSALLCFFFFLSYVFIRFLILQSSVQDWLLQCTHIAHLIDCMCPHMADPHRRRTEKVNPNGTVNPFELLSSELLPVQITTLKTL